MIPRPVDPVSNSNLNCRVHNLIKYSDVNRPARPIGQPPAWPISAAAGQRPAGPADPKVKILRNTQIRAILIDIIEFNNTQGTKMAQKRSKMTRWVVKSAKNR